MATAAVQKQGERSTVASTDAAAQLRVSRDVFRFIAEVLLKVPVERIGKYHLYPVESVGQVDAYLRHHDPRGRFRVDPKPRGPRKPRSPAERPE